METSHIETGKFIQTEKNTSYFGLTGVEPERASRIVGFSWILMFVLAIPTVLLVLEKLVIKGDTARSIQNIKENQLLLYIRIASYFIILTLDAIIAVGLYNILKFTNRRIAMIMSILRVLFVITTAISLIGLAFLRIDFYSIGVLIGYVFLIPHLFLVGYLAIRSWYVPKGIGIFMILTALSYIITIFGVYLLTTSLYDQLYPIAMVPASLGEITMGIYLIIRAKLIAERIDY